MKLSTLLAAAACMLLALSASAQEKSAISWKKLVLDTEFRSEGVGVADVNKDGSPDVIVGDCWYEAPTSGSGPWKRHILRTYRDKKDQPVPADRKFDLLVYSKSFGCFTDDFNSDGWPDAIVIPFPGEPCYWYENPGKKGGLWKEHMVTNSACNETPIYVDLFKTGKKVLVMGWNPQKDDKDIKKGNHDDRGELCYFLPGTDPTLPWQRVSVSGPSVPGKPLPGTRRFDHGLGHGDVNGDGRLDILVTQGWWEQPAKLEGGPWKFHPGKITDPCADMHTYDLDNDGKMDIVSTSAHNYGFWWSQQKDLSSFLQRPIYLPPSEIAKPAADVKFTKEESSMYTAINKVRNDHFKRAPFAADAELCMFARQVAEQLVNGTKRDHDAYLGAALKGKLVHWTSQHSKDPSDLKEVALALLPNQEKYGERVLPHFTIGVGAAPAKNGGNVYVLLIADRGKFSLPSQTHALNKVDIDGDGLDDLVTGRRWWAHGPKGDAGPNDPAYLYWFQAKRGKDGMISFTPRVIDDSSGIGTQFTVADMNGDGRPDIIVSNKKGVHVFLQSR